MSGADVRVAFEEWLIAFDGCADFDRDEDGRYVDFDTQRAWAAWQASRSETSTSDIERLDWLERQGMIGIHHEAYGDYTHYAGDCFDPVREVIDAQIAKERARG